MFNIDVNVKAVRDILLTFLETPKSEAEEQYEQRERIAPPLRQLALSFLQELSRDPTTRQLVKPEFDRHVRRVVLQYFSRQSIPHSEVYLNLFFAITQEAEVGGALPDGAGDIDRNICRGLAKQDDATKLDRGAINQVYANVESQRQGRHGRSGPRHRGMDPDQLPKADEGETRLFPRSRASGEKKRSVWDEDES